MTAKNSNGQLPLGDADATAPRPLVMNGGGELLDPFPPGSKAEAMFGTGKAVQTTATETPDDDDDTYYWELPARDKIEFHPTKENVIEIYQRSPVGESEDTRIDVHFSDAVGFARRVLWAAGFKTVLIATGDIGGYVDLEDGSVA